MKKLIVCMMFLVSSVWAHNHHDHQELDANRPQPLNDESLYNLQAKWISQSGEKMELSQLRGHPVVITMIYTSCKTACPLLAADMKRIQEALPAQLKEETKFVFVSFDSEHDTPDRLRKFMQSHHLTGHQWTVAKGENRDVQKLAALLGIKFKKAEDGSYAHSNVITLLSKEGIILHQQTGLRQDPAPLLEKLKN